MSKRQYELVIIVDPSVDERTVTPSLEKYLSVITSGDGSIDNVDVWGKKRLAYEINKKSEGIYVVVNYTATPESAQELSRQLNLNESILRTKLIRPDAH